MIGRKRLLRVAAVLSVAFATGQAVENLRSSAAGSTDGGSGLNGRLPSSASLQGGGTGHLPEIKGITPVSAASERSKTDDCPPSISLSAAEGAMIDLTLIAPCDPGQRIVIRHAGLSFTAVTALDGTLLLQLPALEREALVAAYFEGSSVALAAVSVPDAAEHIRFAFQAPFPVDFELRAAEGGTVYVGGSGGPGQDVSGRIITLGTEAVAQPLIAQVYTFPGGDTSQTKLSVEVRINDRTCSRSFVAETRFSKGGNITATTMPIAIPLCGTSGDILVLKNLVPDMTLAAPM